MKMYHSDYELYWTVDKRAIPLFEELNVPYILRFTFNMMDFLKMFRLI